MNPKKSKTKALIKKKTQSKIPNSLNYKTHHVSKMKKVKKIKMRKDENYPEDAYDESY